MPQRLGLPLWASVVGSVLSAAVVLLRYRATHMEQRLKALRDELVSAKGQSVYSKSDTADVERVAEDLRLKLLYAERELKRLNEAVNQARAEVRKRDERIAMLSKGMATCDEFF
jgi:chromosome segregation ATPase